MRYKKPTACESTSFVAPKREMRYNTIMAKSLIAQIASGSRDALKELYDTYRTFVYAVSLSLLKNQADAEDITAETFISVAKHAASFRGGSEKSYLAAVARNLSLNLIKKRKFEVFTDFSVSNESEQSCEGAFENAVVLKAALQLLDDEQRQIVLFHVAGMKHRETAAILKIPLGTVTWKYKKAIAIMEEYLKEDKA